MAPSRTLRDELDVLDRMLVTLHELRLAIVSGAAPTPRQLERLIEFVEDCIAFAGEAEAKQAHLLAILRETACRLGDDSGLARRQFFHAARAYLTLRKGRLDDSARFPVAERTALATA